jgi:hypothetical protein
MYVCMYINTHTNTHTHTDVCISTYVNAQVPHDLFDQQQFFLENFAGRGLQRVARTAGDIPPSLPRGRLRALATGPKIKYTKL